MLMPTEDRTRRDAWLPPPPSPAPSGRRPDPQTTNRDALRELAELIAELERWRRRQEAPKPGSIARWAFVRDAHGQDVRIRFERGEPVQLRTSSTDHMAALGAASAALDLALMPIDRWRRDEAALDYVVSVRAADQ